MTTGFRTIDITKPYRILKSTSADFQSMLRARIATDQKNYASLHQFLSDVDGIKDQLDSTDKNVFVSDKYPNTDIEIVYKLHHWAASDFPEGVLLDVLEGSNLGDLINHYSHFFRVSPLRVHFLKSESSLTMLAQAAVWASDILRALSKYTRCIPLYVLPIILEGFPHKQQLDMMAPGLFVFDLIYLYPETFPLCQNHESCGNFCFNYGLQQLESNRTFKLIAAILSLGCLNNKQLGILFQHAKSSDPDAPKSLAEFKEKSKTFISLNTTTQKYELIHPKITAAECKKLSSNKQKTTSVAPPDERKKVVHARNFIQQNEVLKSQDQIVGEIAIEYFMDISRQEVTVSELTKAIKRKYYEISDLGIDVMEIRYSLLETPYFMFTDTDTVLFSAEGAFA